MSVVAPHPVLDALVAAYNAHDAAAFAGLLTDDVVIAAYPGRVLQSSADEVRAHYQTVFTQFPKNTTKVAHRIVLGDRVIDHEMVSRGDGSPMIDVVSINTIERGRISRIEFVSAVKVGE